ncbi:hypothetical protein N9L92_01960 [Saprospiraceae bacterium]|nr:hypothetical protein [Saprospiraceae bacterium]
MTEKQATYLIKKLNQKDVKIESGLNEDEINKIQNLFNLIFPPDLRMLYQKGLPIDDSFPNWRKSINQSTEEIKRINQKLDWPLEGMLFDIEHNSFWQDEWGAKNNDLESNSLLAKNYFQNYPKLIPIYSHRYIPSTPNEKDNPIFSVHQMDIIYYGMNLANYLSNEFDFKLDETFVELENPAKEIKFWSKWT